MEFRRGPNFKYVHISTDFATTEEETFAHTLNGNFKFKLLLSENFAVQEKSTQRVFNLKSAVVSTISFDIIWIHFVKYWFNFTNLTNFWVFHFNIAHLKKGNIIVCSNARNKIPEKVEKCHFQKFKKRLQPTQLKFYLKDDRVYGAVRKPHIPSIQLIFYWQRSLMSIGVHSWLTAWTKRQKKCKDLWPLS